jgi:DNA-directed RNA polymerase specialized sigma24 family protein
MAQVHELLENALGGFRASEFGWGEFLRRTRPAWKSYARQLMRRWRAPDGVELDDVVQELQLGAFRAIGRYDAERSPRLKRIANPTDADVLRDMRRYVAWNACDVAKKWLHRQRLGHRPHRGEDSARSVIARPFGRMRLDDEGPRDLPLAVERACTTGEDEPTATAVAEAREAWCRATTTAAIRCTWLMPGLLALERSRGDLDAAAEAVYGDLDARLRSRLGSPADARELVELAAGYVFAHLRGAEAGCVEFATGS